MKDIDFFREEKLKNNLNHFISNLENYFTKVIDKGTLKKMKLFVSDWKKSIPNPSEIEASKENFFSLLKSINKSEIEFLISFLKNEIKQFNKINKNNNSSTEICYAETFLEELLMINGFINYLSSNFKSFITSIIKFIHKKSEMLNEFLTSYFDFFINFFTDLKARISEMNNSDSIGFFLVNQDNIDLLNIIIQFKM